MAYKLFSSGTPVGWVFGVWVGGVGEVGGHISSVHQKKAGEEKQDGERIKVMKRKRKREAEIAIEREGEGGIEREERK